MEDGDGKRAGLGWAGWLAAGSDPVRCEMAR